jgi:UDP-N-acetylglucosamine 2-epimerase (non-hydrolysing)/GDP/UDP-N,N'-diacetylbacillosamine 2-epimerase (hydrolysing)
MVPEAAALERHQPAPQEGVLDGPELGPLTKRHVVVVSGSRADYSLLLWPMRRLAAEPGLRLSIAATGMHLATDFGSTVDQFAADGFDIAARVDTLDAEDSPAGIARAIGRGVTGFSAVFADLDPDLVLVLGDRYEIFAAVQAAFVAKLPIAHLCGGDVTDGAIDDAFRHSISKMASLHFPTNVAAARRLRQLGEAEDRIFEIGSPGIDAIRKQPAMERGDLARALGHDLAERYLLITFHPVTLDPIPSVEQIEELLAALEMLSPELGLVFTLANADAEGRAINARIRRFVGGRRDAAAHVSLGPALSLNLMRHAAAVVGNSSSGLYEAPSLDRPTVNIGRRQEGRLRAVSVIDCPPSREEIRRAIGTALDMKLKGVVNPYGDGTASERLVQVLASFSDWKPLVYKSFRDLQA